MKHLVSYSGGKDSGGLLCWAKETLGEPGINWIPAFWNTKWEHPITYAHINQVNEEFLGGTLVIRSSKKYPDGFVQLVVERKGFPSVKRRFCTSELKVTVQHEFIQELDDEVTVYTGVRADESDARALLKETEWVEDAGGYWVNRPLLRASAEDCFAIAARHGLKPNPLYLMGITRVGCWPCIMVGLRELKRMIIVEPTLKSRLIELETYVNENVANRETRKWKATFWAAGTIPDRFCSLQSMVECRKCKGTGKVATQTEAPLFILGSESGEATCKNCDGAGEYMAFVPTAKDVFNYVENTNEVLLPMGEHNSCMSVYNLCE